MAILVPLTICFARDLIIDPPLPRELANLQRDPELARLHAAWHNAVALYVKSIGHDLASGNLVPEQAWAYLNLARRNTSVVCEAGFYRGVSAHLWLTANRSIVVHSFDVDFPPSAVSALRERFGDGRLRTHRGSTRHTLPRFPPDVACDLISIDASHDGWEPYLDFKALMPHARCGATVLFDDTFDDRALDKQLDNDPSRPTFYNACTRSYWRLVREGLLHHVACTSLGRRPLRWGRGRWRHPRPPHGR